MAENKGQKILVAEDDKFLCKVYEAKLNRDDFTVLSAHDGQEAYDMIKSEKPDLILLDLIMPKMDGFDVLVKLQADADFNKKTPIIVLSNLGQGSDTDLAKQLGASDYIVKSNSSIEDIVKKIKALL